MFYNVFTTHHYILKRMVFMKKKIVAMILAVVFMIGLVVPVMAAEAGSSTPSQVSSISLEQAVEMALTNSLTLQSAELSIERAKEVRDKVATGVDYTPTDNNSGEAAAAFELSLIHISEPTRRTPIS